jgi:hypothetical protein
MIRSSIGLILPGAMARAPPYRRVSVAPRLAPGYFGSVADSVISGPREKELRPRTSRARSGVLVGRRSALGVLTGSFVAALISLAAAAWALHLWRADLGVPLRYAPVDDAKFYLMLVKGIIEHGWFQTNGSLGAPFGQQLYDFPQSADNLNLLLIRALSLGSSSPAVVANLFYLATFALAAGCGYAVLRALGLLAPAALVGSVLFSLLTYHFFRGESHLLLSAYYAVPLSCYLFLCLLDERSLFARRVAHGSAALAWASRRTAATVALCVVIGSESLYYATFAEVLLLAATLFALILRRRRATVLSGALVCMLIAATLGLNLAPSVIYQLEHGANVTVRRSAASDEAHGLKLTNLVVPPPDDRIGALRHISSTYDHAVAPTYCEACYGALGAVGTAGLGWLALCGLGSLIGAASWFGSHRLFRHASAAIAIALAVASLGGLSSLIEFFITPDIRGWNRISVFIAFFALLAVAVLLDALIRSARRRGGAYRLWPAVVLAVVVFGAYEQTSDYFIPNYAADRAQYRSDGSLVATIQQRLSPGAAVFELPYVPFPEGYEGGDVSTSFELSYELARGYIHSHSLRWSYGAMKGRAADWSAELAGQPLSSVMPAVAASGFQGLWVEPDGYGPNAPQVGSTLTALLGQPITSPAGDLWFFDLRPYAARLRAAHGGAQVRALRQATLWPLRVACSSTGLVLHNPLPHTRGATLRVRFTPTSGLATPVRMALAQSTLAAVTVGAGGSTLSAHLKLAPGSTRLRISLPAASGLQLSNVVLSDDALAPFSTAMRTPGEAAPDAPTPGLAAPSCVVG